MNSGLERECEKVVVAQFKVIFRHFVEGMREITANLDQNTRFVG
jgi:hypothetical protein